MSSTHRIVSGAWLLVPLLAAVFLVRMDAERIGRVQILSTLVGETPARDASSPTGYAGGMRHLIVPEHNAASYQWIAQTQQMLARGEWRLRHAGYDNAPDGRPVLATSPYRWWLGLVATFIELFSGTPAGIAVESAALYADPALHLLLLVTGALFAGRFFGPLAGVAVSLGMLAVFPLAGAFLPGQPEHHALTLTFAWWSVALVLAGLRASGGTAQRWFTAAGVVGGLGIWVSAASLVPILSGLALGGAFAVWANRRSETPSNVESASHWRRWSIAGALTCGIAFLVEYAPSTLGLGSFRLGEIHYLYAIAWFGVGELIARFAAWLTGERQPWTKRGAGTAALALLAVLSVPATMVYERTSAFLTPDLLATRLSNLPKGAVAESLAEWVMRDGATAMFACTLVPLLGLGAVVWLLWRKKEDGTLIVAGGPIVVAFVLACTHLRWWAALDAMVLLLVAVTLPAAAAAIARPAYRWALIGGVVLTLLPGFALLRPPSKESTKDSVSEVEIKSLIGRDFAHWLANRVGSKQTVVLAPPAMTTSLFYHGGLRGLGSPYRENMDGFSASVRIAGATSPDEAQALAQRRELTHIVIPSWDGFLDEYARLASNQPENSLVAMLGRWLPPRWLAPVAYQLPGVVGFEAESIAVFEAVDVQDNATALSRLGEYFVEMGQMAPAVSIAQALEKFFPSDLGALAARVQIAAAADEPTSVRATIEAIKPYLTGGADRALLWDRRVALAIALARGEAFDLARSQAGFCADDVDEAHLRSLSTVSLYRLLLLNRMFAIEFPDARLERLARGLLPVELRAQL